MNTIIIIGLIILSIIKYFEEDFCIGCLRHGRQITSFIIGASIVTIFVDLFNDIYQEIHSTNNLILLILPLAFIIMLFIERHIYHHVSKKIKGHELGLMTKGISLISGILMGIIVYHIPAGSIMDHIILLSVLISYELIRDLSFHIIHEERHGQKMHHYIFKFFIALSPFYGLTLAHFIGFSPIINAALLTFFGGILLYVMMREIVVPQENKISPLFFISGTVAITLLFLINYLS